MDSEMIFKFKNKNFLFKVSFLTVKTSDFRGVTRR